MVKEYRVIKQGERGQSFMELAISLVFLLILLSVVIELGWAFYTMTALRDTAQEAASFAAICPSRGGAANTDEIKERLQASATAPINGSDISLDDIQVNYYSAGGGEIGVATHGDIVRVSVTIHHKIIVPFAGSFLGDTYSYPLTATVSDTVMTTECKD
jgi:Flp pilus assembly protein TadG